MLEPNHRILVIDDNPAIHSDFRKILCPEGARDTELSDLKAALFERSEAQTAEVQFELTSAFQGQQALELVKEAEKQGRPFAMAFLDVRMPPGWDGVETAARLWEVCPELQIVICTAYSDYSWAEMRSRLPQPDSLVVLKKPFDNVEVQQLAHAMTKKWLLNREARLKVDELERMVEERTRQLQKTNASLSASEERFSKAFHCTPLANGILRLSDQRFVDANERLSRIVGYSHEQLVGQTAAELFLWDKPEVAEQWVGAVRGGTTVHEQEARLRTPDGALHEVLVSCAPVEFGGEPHMLLVAQDVAHRALLERQLRQAQKMEAIGQLAAGVAHDFNNILTVIQGHAGLMEQSLQPGNPATKSLHQISLASNRAATLIRQLLMFSRKQVMQFRYLDLNEALGNAIKMLERLVGEHVRIEFQPQQGLPSVHADAGMLDQVVMNLAVNARDAMPGGGRIVIRTRIETMSRPATPMDPHERNGEFVCLSFADTGCGMDTQVLSRVFEPFFTTKPVGKGTGLGLSTVFGIVRAHRGWMDVESRPGQGSRFRLYFPACRQPAERSEAIVDALLKTGRETVLVAEDEDALREMVVNVLRIQGYTVYEAASGTEALEIWERVGRPIDLLLTDMVMPGGIMGRELAESLLAKAPKLKIIYTSGYSPGMAEDTSVLKGRNFLPKPYTVGKLAQFVRECLDAPAKN